MTRGDGIGKHRPLIGPVEINATYRFDSCPQWVDILETIGDSRMGIITQSSVTVVSNMVIVPYFSGRRLA
jgi:hypothetical protein